MGVWAEGADELSMDVYDGSQTLANILEDGQFVANFPGDASMLYTALRAPEQLAFSEARLVRAPVVAGCTASVELTLGSTATRGDTVRIVGNVKRVHHTGAPRLINRAEGLLLESLVLATRLERQAMPLCWRRSQRTTESCARWLRGRPTNVTWKACCGISALPS